MITADNAQTSTQDELLTPEEAAQEILANLAKTYTLADKVAISKTMRRLLRTETEEAQKQLANLLDSL